MDGCFEQYTNGQTDTNGNTVICPTDEGNVPYPTCSGYMRQDSVGQSCRQQCTSSQHADYCYEHLQQFCRDYSGSLECRCLEPNGTSFGEGNNQIAYNELQQYVQENHMESVSPRCFYPACFHPSSVIPEKDGLECPPLRVYCAVSNVSVSLSHVTANSINIIQQKCGLGGDSSEGNSQGGTSVPSTLASLFRGGSVSGTLAVLILFGLLFVAVMFGIYKMLEKTERHKRFDPYNKVQQYMAQM